MYAVLMLLYTCKRKKICFRGLRPSQFYFQKKTCIKLAISCPCILDKVGRLLCGIIILTNFLSSKFQAFGILRIIFSLHSLNHSSACISVLIMQTKLKKVNCMFKKVKKGRKNKLISF